MRAHSPNQWTTTEFLRQTLTLSLESFFFLILFYLTLQYCIGFAIYQNESATGIHMFIC